SGGRTGDALQGGSHSNARNALELLGDFGAKAGQCEIEIGAPKIGAPEDFSRERRRRLMARFASGFCPRAAEEFEHCGVVFDRVALAVAIADQRAASDLLAPIKSDQ